MEDDDEDNEDLLDLNEGGNALRDIAEIRGDCSKKNEKTGLLSIILVAICEARTSSD